MRRALILAAFVLALLSLPRRSAAGPDDCPANDPCDMPDGGEPGVCSANGECTEGKGC